MRYEGVIYRPPSEAHSLLIQATIGCPHNKCTFCAMYKEVKFRLRSVEDIKADLKEAEQRYGRAIPNIFFPDGNTIIMKTDQLAEIFTYSHQLFPHLQRITLYGAARFITKKSMEDLIRLKAAGLSRIHMGMESGDDVTLQQLQKGSNAEMIIDAGTKVKKAGIDLSMYYLVGAGGLERTREHAEESARVVSAIRPDFLRLRTLVPVPNTPLWDQYQRGEFSLLSPHQALREIYILVKNLEANGTQVLSDHVSNYWNVEGIIPADREHMLAEIDRALTIDESRFRSPLISQL
ncbi:MAG: B12-binding domain-containing radical SAM protein [Candidatus Saccharibacteria bacterium]